MRPQSAKAKGRRLQQEVRDAVLAAFPQLKPDDVRSTSMGAGGADLLLSPAAQWVFPFYVECKNQESLNIWAALEQAEMGAFKDSLVFDRPISHSIPLVVFRRNATKPYVAFAFNDFMELLKYAHA